jgi:hypothetical protein
MSWEVHLKQAFSDLRPIPGHFCARLVKVDLSSCQVVRANLHRAALAASRPVAPRTVFFRQEGPANNVWLFTRKLVVICFRSAWQHLKRYRLRVDLFRFRSIRSTRPTIRRRNWTLLVWLWPAAAPNLMANIIDLVRRVI